MLEDEDILGAPQAALLTKIHTFLDEHLRQRTKDPLPMRCSSQAEEEFIPVDDFSGSKD